ncbi:MAG TPA: tRNA-binding protein [Clostridiaceae bacterium]|nr:tRNA-binding protein [Clostridiaceae bacterium]
MVDIKEIGIADFDKVDVRIGTIISAKPNKRSKNPSYVLQIDFGEELGVKNSSAQITDVYTEEDLIGKQVACCVNLKPMYIGSVKSEVRILGSESEQGIVLLVPEFAVKNGDKVS